MSNAAAATDIKVQSVDGGVTAPAGFKAAGVLAGIKASPQLDLALVVSDELASAAGSSRPIVRKPLPSWCRK